MTNPSPVPPEFETLYHEALAREAERKRKNPYAQAVHFNAQTRAYFIRLTTGVGFEMPADAIAELAGASMAQLAKVERFGEGEGLHWDGLDVDISIATLLNRAFGDTIRSLAARKAASTTSNARAKAARENGKKGGRPRKKAAS